MLTEGESMSKRESYFIRSEGPDQDSVKKAFSWLLQRGKPLGYIALNVYGNLEVVIKDIVGDFGIKSLKQYGKLNVSGSEILLVTERKMIYNAGNAPLVAFYPAKKFLDELDSIPNISAMLVVPWTLSEVEPWIRAWNASELGAPPAKRIEPLVRNKVVERALRSLTSCVNLSTGISHSRDRSAAVQMFEILRDARESFEPEEVKAWLVGEGGWKATDADEVAEVARKILAGRKLRTGMPAWADNILDIWKKEVAESS